MTTPKFKIGDRVRILPGGILAGYIGDITHPDLDRDGRYCSVTLVESGRDVAVHSVRLSLALEPAPPASLLPSILEDLTAELQRATDKFPTWSTDPVHAAGVVLEEAGELVKEVNQMTYEPGKSTRETVRAEALQTAAMAVRFLMSLDRYVYSPSPQHTQS